MFVRLRPFATGCAGLVFVMGCTITFLMRSCAGTLDAINMTLHRELPVPTSEIEVVKFTPQGDKIVAGGNDGVYVWDFNTGKQLFHISRNPPKGVIAPDVQSLAILPNGHLLVGGRKKLELWDIETGKLIRSFPGHEGPVYAIAVSADGQRALSGTGFKIGKNTITRGECLIRLWDLESGKELKRFEGHGGAITALAFLPDGRRFISSATDWTMRLWNVETGEEIRRFGDPPRQPDVIADLGQWRTSIEITKDGKYVLRGLMLWDIEAWKRVSSVSNRDYESIFCAAFSPDESRVLATDGWAIRVWDFATKTEIASAKAFRNGATVYSVAISPDGRYVVSGGHGWVGFSSNLPAEDRTVRIWELPQK